MPVSTPSLDEVIERARREKWTRLALLSPRNAGEDSWRKQRLRDRGWADECLVAVTEVDGEPADLIARVAQIESLKELAIEYPHVGGAGAQAIAKHLSALTSLDLGGNNIGDAGARAIALHLHTLTALHLWDNSIGDAGASAIAQHLHALTSLNLGFNRIDEEGTLAIAEHLSALTSLNLAEDDIDDAGALAIAQRLSALTSLDLGGNNIDDAGARAIAQRLSALTSLNLGYNSIGDAGARAIAQHLRALTSLDLSGNSIDEKGARAIAQRLRALTSLDLGDNTIGDAGARAIAQHLRALTSLDLANNSISDAGAHAIAKHLSALTSLNLENNSISEEGVLAIVHRLRRLRDLNLSANNISALPDEIGHQSDLVDLNLEDNDLVALPRTLLRLPAMRTLRVSRNPRLNIPPELADRELDAARILAWYFGQKRRLNEAKVLMVGQGGVGKTSLVSAVLYRSKADPNERKTEKICIDTWTIPSRHAGETIRVNVWDFGGQEIMHATHQFFLTKRSVYVLVLDARQGEIEGNIHYWLQTIQSFGGDSPVLVVTNKCDVQPLSLNENGLKRQYAPMEIGFHSVSCTTLDGIDGLKVALVMTIQGLAHVDDELPAPYFEVKAELEKSARDRHYFEMADYAKLCEKLWVSEKREQSRLLRFLHDLGTVLNFDDPDSPYQVGDTNILNPEWVTEGVYAIINNQPLMQAQGQLELKRLPDILKDNVRYPRDKQRFIVEMMRKFELCFDFPDRPNTLLVPELLTKNEPDVNWRDAEECLNFEYAYEVLPSGLLPRFIVRMHHALTDKPTYWRSGVVLAIDGCKVLVRGDSRSNVIRISVDGRLETRRGALATVRDQFKGIHATIPKLKVEERVPLPDFPHVAVPYDYLLQLEELSRSQPDTDMFIPQGLRMGEARKYSARKLLSGIEVAGGKPTAPPARKRPPDQDRGLDVFIKYPPAKPGDLRA